MKEVCVIIPVYKLKPSSDEVFSITQTLSVLRKYDIYLVCPNTLLVEEYLNIAKNSSSSLIIRRFSDSYFKDIHGYNRLLLSDFFYRCFSDYHYILICQPDAYVFRDELIEWCKKEYDYIGAPLIVDNQNTVFSSKMRVGNGGFSLRNIDTIRHFFNSKKNVFSPSEAARVISLKKKPYTRVFVWLLMLFGWRNKPASVAARWKYNEDIFWSGLLDNSNFALKKPTPETAMYFSFERFPSELFELTGHQLPFGCHAWRKYQYEEFWKYHLSKES